MSEAKQMLFARNVICICIEKKESGDYIGLLWHQYSDDPIEFNGVSDMLMLMDDLYDEWDFPQRSLEKREFNKTRDHEEMNGDPDNLVIDKVQAASGVKNVQNKKGSLGTFFVQVKFRQNATWQGTVIHSESNKKFDFTSAMGLVEVIDKSMSSN